MNESTQLPVADPKELEALQVKMKFHQNAEKLFFDWFNAMPCNLQIFYQEGTWVLLQMQEIFDPGQQYMKELAQRLAEYNRNEYEKAKLQLLQLQTGAQ